jgi:predicted DCC family thiol-disulfide oxidoreductase YuxK
MGKRSTASPDLKVHPARSSYNSIDMPLAPYIVFYDAACHICRRGRQTIERLRPTTEVRFVDMNDARTMAPYPDMAGADLQGQMYVREPSGRVTGGYDALVALAATLPALAWVTPLLASRPLRAIGRPAYRWLAANRYRLGGQAPCHGGACAIDPVR